MHAIKRALRSLALTKALGRSSPRWAPNRLSSRGYSVEIHEHLYCPRESSKRHRPHEVAKCSIYSEARKQRHCNVYHPCCLGDDNAFTTKASKPVSLAPIIPLYAVIGE